MCEWSTYSFVAASEFEDRAARFVIVFEPKSRSPVIALPASFKKEKTT